MSSNLNSDHLKYKFIATHLSKRTKYRPVVGIICGSGLSGLSRCLQDPVTITYESIPYFPQATVAGHHGELVFGTMGGIEVVCMRGRFHYYEGNDMQDVVLPVRVMRLMGVKLLIITNAAGGLNPGYDVGDIMIIQDHFGLPCIAGNTPLRGSNDDSLGPRFPAISNAYDEELQSIMLACADTLSILNVMRPGGTYCYVSGPAYESRAECRFLRSIGGDSVGMSTIPEVLAAKHCGMKILGLSLITNKVVTQKGDAIHASHEEVLTAVEKSGRNVEALVRAFITKEKIGDYMDDLQDILVKDHLLNDSELRKYEELYRKYKSRPTSNAGGGKGEGGAEGVDEVLSRILLLGAGVLVGIGFAMYRNRRL